MTNRFTRRAFLGGLATASVLSTYNRLAAADLRKVKIRDIKVMVLAADRQRPW